jgi:translocation and assembly module TamB
VTIAAGAGSVRVAVHATRGADRLIQLDGELGAPASALLQSLPLHQVQLSVAGDLGPLSLAEVQAFAPGDAASDQPTPNGIVRAHIDVHGTSAAPVAALDGRVEKLGLAAEALGAAELTYRYAGGVSQLQSHLVSASGGKLDLQGRANLELSSLALQRGIDWRKAPLDGRLVARDFDPAFLSRLVDRVREAGGLVDGDARVGGTLGAPSLDGRVEWRDGRLALTGYGQYRRIHLLLEGSQHEINLRDLSAESGAGRVTLTARGDRRGDALELSGGGELTRFPMIVDDQLRAIVTARFTLAGEATADVVEVRELAIPQAQVELPQVRRKDLQDLDRPKDVILVRNGEPLYKRRPSIAAGEGGAATAGEATADDAGYRGRRYVFLLSAPRNIWIRGVDINAEVGLSNQFRVELADRAYLFGEVRFLRGRVDVLGRRFDLLRDSQVRFTGQAQSPFVNVTAEYANEREGVTVLTTVRGQGKDVSLQVSSKPALAEAEIYTLLATGRRTLERGSGASLTGGEAASVVGSFAASQIRRVISNAIPLDVLSIEAGAQGLSDASFEAGKYLTDKVYVGAVGRLGADPEQNENSAAFRVEYRFNSHWSFETEYGDARRGSADVIWSVDY